jgi:hypothetical protein
MKNINSKTSEDEDDDDDDDKTKRSKITKVKRALKGKIRNVSSEDTKLIVPFNLASRLNRQTSITDDRIAIRKQLTTFILANFQQFVDDYELAGKTKNPSVIARMKLYIEVIKMILPKPLDKAYNEQPENRERELIAVLMGTITKEDNEV